MKHLLAIITIVVLTEVSQAGGFTLREQVDAYWYKEKGEVLLDDINEFVDVGLRQKLVEGKLEWVNCITKWATNNPAKPTQAQLNAITQAEVDMCKAAEATVKAEAQFRKAIKVTIICVNNILAEMGKTNRITKAKFIEEYLKQTE